MRMEPDLTTKGFIPGSTAALAVTPTLSQGSGPTAMVTVMPTGNCSSDPVSAQGEWLFDVADYSHW